MNDEFPDFYSVYLHSPAAGVDCVGDFTRFADAEAYARELSATFGWHLTYICLPAAA